MSLCKRLREEHMRFIKNTVGILYWIVRIIKYKITYTIKYFKELKEFKSREVRIFRDSIIKFLVSKKKILGKHVNNGLIISHNPIIYAQYIAIWSKNEFNVNFGEIQVTTFVTQNYTHLSSS